VGHERAHGGALLLSVLHRSGDLSFEQHNLGFGEKLRRESMDQPSGPDSHWKGRWTDPHNRQQYGATGDSDSRLDGPARQLVDF